VYVGSQWVTSRQFDYMKDLVKPHNTSTRELNPIIAIYVNVILLDM